MTDQAQALMALAEKIMPAIDELELSCSDAIMPLVSRHQPGCVVQATEEEWRCQENAFGNRDAFYAALMPDERAAIRILNAAYERLKKLDWNDPIYCPKDGSVFDAIEAGSTGIHKCRYEGEWPTGSWWVYSDGDVWPSRPVLYRRTEAEKAKWAALRARAQEPQG